MRRSPLRRRTRLRPVSLKREALEEERRDFVLRILLERPRCEVTDGHRCPRDSHHVHEKLTRARGGSIVDPTNVLAVCAQHHRQIHDNPAWATELGLLTPSWEAG